MAYMHGRSCWSNRGRSVDLDYPRSGEVQKIRDLMGSVSPSGDIDRKTNTKFRIGGTMLMFSVGENETVNIWMDSYTGGHAVNIWIKSVYLLADSRYNKAVKELLSKYVFDAYKSFAEIEARPLSERFVYVGYAEGDLPKDCWGRIWFEGTEKAENGEKTAENVSVARGVVDSGRGEVRFVEADGSTGIGSDGEPLVERYDLGIAFGSNGSLAAHERLNARLSDTQREALA